MAEIADSITPGSLEYGDRQVMEDRIRQINAQSGQRRQVSPPGQVTRNAQSYLESGPTSDLPVTSGLSVGPGRTPTNMSDPAQGDLAERYRIIAAEARNPYLRHMARSALRALINRKV